MRRVVEGEGETRGRVGSKHKFKDVLRTRDVQDFMKGSSGSKIFTKKIYFDTYWRKTPRETEKNVLKFNWSR